MPPKGYKKGYVKHPETGEYTDPRVLQNEREEKLKTLEPATPKVRVVKKEPVKKKAKDDLGPETKNVRDATDYATVIITWKDSRGRQRNTQYVMVELNINESVHEEFSGAKKKTHLHLSLDGTVLEKT